MKITLAILFCTFAVVSGILGKFIKIYQCACYHQSFENIAHGIKFFEILEYLFSCSFSNSFLDDSLHL